MEAKGLIIVEKDRIGKLADISELLAKHDINIESIFATAIGKMAVIKLFVSDEQAAFSALKEAGFNVMEEATVIIQLKNEPGQLAKVSRMLANARVNIISVRVLDNEGVVTALAIETSDPEKAKEILKEYAR